MESSSIAAAEYAYQRLRQGLGAQLEMDFGKKGSRVVFVPSPIFRDLDRYELLIVMEGKGAIFYDGQRPLTKFMLVAKGFPLQVAVMVVEVVERLFNIKRASPDIKRLESHNKEEESYDREKEEGAGAGSNAGASAESAA